MCCYGNPGDMCTSKFGCFSLPVMGEEAVKSSLNSCLCYRGVTVHNSHGWYVPRLWGRGLVPFQYSSENKKNVENSIQQWLIGHNSYFNS